MCLDICVREIKDGEKPLLESFMYDAIFIPDGEERPSRDVLKFPEISRYFESFGRKGDYCLIAESDNEIIGTVWTRLFSEENRSYGFIDNSTPELAMSVNYQYRNKGIGKYLLSDMLKLIESKGYKQISLSVDTDNFAYEMYKKFGFVDIQLVDKSMTMLKILNVE
jgi:GNAT superfamily N-acetyltransferase